MHGLYMLVFTHSVELTSIQSVPYVYNHAKEQFRYLCDNIGLVGVSAKWSYVIGIMTKPSLSCLLCVLSIPNLEFDLQYLTLHSHIHPHAHQMCICAPCTCHVVFMSLITVFQLMCNKTG